ncbi:MAG: hypothetical protein R3C14_22120 [Caldilineaceae bacterium]
MAGLEVVTQVFLEGAADGERQGVCVPVNSRMLCRAQWRVPVGRGY